MPKPYRVMLAVPCAARLAVGIKQWCAVDGVFQHVTDRDHGGSEAMSMMTLGSEVVPR